MKRNPDELEVELLAIAGQLDRCGDRLEDENPADANVIRCCVAWLRCVLRRRGTVDGLDPLGLDPRD